MALIKPISPYFNHHMNISLCIMVKDETQEIELCLKSFQSLVREILVLDTGDQADIKRVIKSFKKAKRLPFKWVEDFSVARNRILSQATQEWVLMLDSDDLITPTALKKLKDELENYKDSADVICLPYIYNQVRGKNGNKAYLPRLWRRSLNLKYTDPIHEYLNFQEIDPKKVIKLDIPILHQKKLKNIFKSSERNLRIIKSYLKKHPSNLRMLYYLVHDSQKIKDYKTVIQGAKKYLSANPKNAVRTYKTLIRKGRAHLHLNQILLAQESFLLAISINPLYVESYLQLADLYRKQKRFLEAEHFYRCAMLCKKPQQNFDFINMALYEDFAAKELIYLLEEMGHTNESLNYAKKLIKTHPQDKKLQTHIKYLESRS